MRSQGRERGALARGALVAAGLALTATACAPIWGGAALVGLVAIGTLTSTCYDYLDLTVLDAEGRKTCAATVSASNGKSQFELESCYYTPLSDGRWTVRASLPGFPDAVSTVMVEHEHDCIRHVQTVELTLNRAGSSPIRTGLPTPPAAAPPVPVPAPAATPSPPPPLAAPATSSSAVPSAPAGSAAPPIGVFPNTPPETPR